MEEKQISQSQLVELTGKNKSTISQWLSGNLKPGKKAERQLEEILECSFDEMKEEDYSESDGLNLSVPETAKILNKPEQFVREALKQGRAPFGFAVKGSKHWSYHISKKKVMEYVGV